MFETLEAIGKGARAPPAAAGEAEGETQAPRMSGGLWVAGRGEPHGPVLATQVRETAARLGAGSVQEGRSFLSF